jgi:hypothetical protein
MTLELCKELAVAQCRQGSLIEVVILITDGIFN